MNFDIKFKAMLHSDALVEYVEERFAKLERYQIRPIIVHVTFREEGHQKIADVYLKGFQNNFRAMGGSDSFYVSLDICLKKLARQMEKEKAKLKDHSQYLPVGKTNRRAA